MGWLPLFHQPEAVNALVVGVSSAAQYKCRWLKEQGAHVVAVAPIISANERAELAKIGVDYEEIMPQACHVQNKNLLIIATDDDAWNCQFAAQMNPTQMPMFVWHHPELSTVSFPAIIDRDPVITAISASGRSPMVSRYLRTRLEGLIPAGYGRLAELVQQLEQAVKEKLTNPQARRRWWQHVLSGTAGEKAMRGEVQAAKSELEKALASASHHQGSVSLVGAGPGDPELLTFKALRMLQQADVVLYDRLVSEQILKYARRDAELMFVGKKRSHHSVPQDDINQLLVHLAQSGKTVCRLKGGDPFIFGRGGEEIAQLAKAGVSFQVVPGVTAASGCAAYAGIPLTHRDYAQSVRFVTGHLKNEAMNLQWQELVSDEQTVVFYMGLNAIPLIAEQLIKNGAPRQRPAAVIEQGTTQEQKVVISNLSELHTDVCQAQIESPALIIIGEVVRLHDQLHWFDVNEISSAEVDSVLR